ncbi:MlaD family protein [Fibrobacter sp. UWEL]|uniref:MlaD family protein n=1 Tax=Fibrobacter sp. UWEL TaxID=1896209 RepID=UPI00091A69F0|nr:MlaD family protein [Fibrobacter sp. UWEL]SHK75645.1 phospholipid/cholesterol/gamma-HCH transport system substrate-binding protein [Fibrobacter sp. UWEL]
MAFKPLKRINWMEISGLLVGVFLTIAVMVFAIVLYTKLFTSGMIGVEEYRLHSTFEKAFGLRPGTRVQISGVDIGQIGEVEVEGDGVFIEFVIRKQYQPWITDSAKVFAIRDQNMISARVINIDVRRGKGRVLEDGDFLPPGQAQDIETVLETANVLLGRVNTLVDAADSLLGMAMDTGTTIGAMFGSRALYDNLNRQLNRIDDMTYVGKRVLFQTANIMDTLQVQMPTLLNKVDVITTDVGGLITELKPVPQKVDKLMGGVEDLMGNVGGLMGKLDVSLNKADNMLAEVGELTSGLGDFMEATEQTLQSADDLMNGLSDMWIIRRSIPSKDSVPFMVETLW